MEISLLALDQEGMPVTDLEAADLVVTARRKTLPIAYLDPAAATATDQPPPPQAKLFLKLKSEYEAAAPTTVEPRYYILLVDVENNDLLNRPAEMKSMQDFIDQDMEGQDFAAVLSYNGTLHVVQPFGRDREATKEAVARAFDTPRRPAPTLYLRIQSLIDSTEMCEDISNQQTVSTGEPSLAAGGLIPDVVCLQELANQYEQENRLFAENFLEALETTVRIAGGQNGRATVLVYSHGALMDPALELREAFEAVFGPNVHNVGLSIDYDSSSKKGLDDLLDLAARERVSFHFVDTTVEPIGTRSVRRRGMLMPTANPMEIAYASPQSNLRQLAGATGGSFRETQNALEGLRMAKDMERGRYILGVSIEAHDPKTKFPKTEVSSRRPGIRIITGRGVRPQPAAVSTIDGKISLGEPIALPDRGDILMPFMLGFRIEDLDHMPTGKKKERRDVASLSLQLFLKTADGRSIASSYHWIEHTVAASEEEDGRGDVLAFKGGIEGPPGSYRLIALVRNIKTGKIGQIVQNIELGESG
jgi:VWFA-related protein